MADSIARHVAAVGLDGEQVANQIVEGLRGPGLRLALVFADWRIDAGLFARATQRGLSPAPVVGASTLGVIAHGEQRPGVTAVGLGLYGDWLRVGIGVAPELSKSALSRSRDAVQQAAIALRTTASGLDPARHVGITVFDGRSGQEEAFCIGSAAAAPQIRMVGGCAATELESNRRPFIWVQGEVMSDAGVVVVLDSELPFYAVTSAHLVPTDVKTVVTAASGRVIEELDGRPAVQRLEELVSQLGDQLDRPRPSRFSFARYVGGLPYVRSITHLVDGDLIHVASAVETGHVLRLMRPGDLIATTKRDLAAASERVGGTMSALLAMSCIGRHWEAGAIGVADELAEVYAKYPTVGYQSFGEQSGMLLVNHTLTGIAIGARR
ncbi:MAG: FIST signal transduction protein [Kofleriaceae bacterium]